MCATNTQLGIYSFMQIFEGWGDISVGTVLKRKDLGLNPCHLLKEPGRWQPVVPVLWRWTLKSPGYPDPSLKAVGMRGAHVALCHRRF